MDAGQIHQVVTNLITNAIEAVGTDGEIRVSAEIDAESARIVVEDDGPGVAPSDRTRIFEPFVTKRPTHARSSPAGSAESSARSSAGPPPGSSRGTGLGLAVSYGIVAAHGGTLRVEDRESGHGARFVVELPMGPTRPSDPTRPRTES